VPYVRLVTPADCGRPLGLWKDSFCFRKIIIFANLQNISGSPSTIKWQVYIALLIMENNQIIHLKVKVVPAFDYVRFCLHTTYPGSYVHFRSKDL
jgi:hypothetical protein